MPSHRLILTVLYALILPSVSRTVDWGHRSWLVRPSSDGAAGPGPNNWTDSPTNVFVGADGHLNLVVSKDSGSWSCVEISLNNSLGLGTYEFAVASAVDELANSDPNLVLGVFLYRDDTHELDVEFARWGNADANATNADYVNQPNTGSSKALLWTQPPGLNATTHQIVYERNRVTWNSFITGHPTKPYQTFNSTTLVPAAAGMLVHINFWLFRGTPLRDGQKNATVKLSSFEFNPAAGGD